MKKNLKLIIILALILVICCVITVTVYTFSIIKYEEVYTEVIVRNNSAAFGIDKENTIRFGIISPGNSATRKFTVNTDQKVYVQIKIEGPANPFVTASENNFIVNPGESKTIELVATVPEATPEGTYPGKLEVYFFRPWFR